MTRSRRQWWLPDHETNFLESILLAIPSALRGMKLICIRELSETGALKQSSNHQKINMEKIRHKAKFMLQNQPEWPGLKNIFCFFKQQRNPHDHISLVSSSSLISPDKIKDIYEAGRLLNFCDIPKLHY